MKRKRRKLNPFGDSALANIAVTDEAGERRVPSLSDSVDEYLHRFTASEADDFDVFFGQEDSARNIVLHPTGFWTEPPGKRTRIVLDTGVTTLITKWLDAPDLQWRRLRCSSVSWAGIGKMFERYDDLRRGRLIVCRRELPSSLGGHRFYLAASVSPEVEVQNQQEWVLSVVTSNIAARIEEWVTRLGHELETITQAALPQEYFMGARDVWAVGSESLAARWLPQTRLIEQFRVSDAVYQFNRPLMGFYLTRRKEFLMEEIGEFIVGHGASVEEAKFNCEAQAHSLVQRVRRFGSERINPAERLAYFALCKFLVMERLETSATWDTPHAGEVLDTPPGGPWRVQWSSGRIVEIPLDKAPPEFAALEKGDYLEGVVSYCEKTNQFVRLKSCRIMPRQPAPYAEQHADRFWKELPHGFPESPSMT